MGLGFEIVGFFLFVGGFLYLALSGRLVNMFRDRAPKPILLVVLVTVVAVHHWLGLLSEPMPSTAAEPPERHKEVETVEPPRPAPRVPKRRPINAATTPTPALDPPPAKAPESERWDTVIVKEGTPEQVFVPQVVDPAPPPQPSQPWARSLRIQSQTRHQGSWTIPPSPKNSAVNRASREMTVSPKRSRNVIRRVQSDGQSFGTRYRTAVRSKR